jgi:hypothetical protein
MSLSNGNPIAASDAGTGECAVAMAAVGGNPKSDWRRRESRQAKKYFGKRLTDADHELIKNYAQSLKVDMSDLIAPYVATILEEARAHAQSSALAS